MAKTYADGSVKYIPVDEIQIDKKEIGNRPIDKEHVKSLAESIRRSGLDTPLMVWNGGGENGSQVEIEAENGEVSKVPCALLIAGFHRLAAIKSIRKAEPETYDQLFPDGVPVMVKGGEIQEALAAQVRENVARKDLEGSDALQVLTRLRDEYGMKAAKIAKEVGKSEAWVSEILSIEKHLGSEGVEAVKGKKLKLSDALKVSKDVKESKKAGKEPDVKGKLEKAINKRKAATDEGRERAPKKVGAKALWKAYSKLPKTSIAAKLTILEGTLGYLAGDDSYETPPTELVKTGSDSED